MRWPGKCLPVVLALSMTLSAARRPGDPLKPGFNLFTRDDDVQVGKEAAAEIRQRLQAVQNPFLQDYIARVGKRISAQSEAGGYPYTYTLVNEKTINAFALPGGPTFVFTGLLSIVDNEAELAGVLAHETAHVALRHGTHQATSANLIQIPLILASVLAGNSLFGQLTQIGIGVGANSVLLKFSRESEIEADALGTHLMAQAGYNPIEMAHFFEKLEAHAGPQLPQFLSDHPNPGNRVRAVGAEIQTLPHRSYGYVTGDFERAKRELGKTPVAKASGFREPSAAYRQLKGRKFSFSYPDNWQPVGDLHADSVILGNPQDGYGIIARYFSPKPGRTDLRAATDDLVNHLRMTPSGSPRRAQADGYPALVTQLANGEQTNRLLTVERPEGLFYLMWIAPHPEFSGQEGAWEEILSSVRFGN
jgi:predicted Zn-dependent protease